VLDAQLGTWVWLRLMAAGTPDGNVHAFFLPRCPERVVDELEHPWIPGLAIRLCYHGGRESKGAQKGGSRGVFNNSVGGTVQWSFRLCFQSSCFFSLDRYL